MSATRVRVKKVTTEWGFLCLVSVRFKFTVSKGSAKVTFSFDKSQIVGVLRVVKREVSTWWPPVEE
jgi:hypothetical protein